jgi:hypothetical protein
MEEDFEKNNKLLRRKKTTKSGKILLLAGLFVVVVLLVFGVLFFASRKRGNSESVEWFSRISETKESVLSAIDYSPESMADLDTGKLEQLRSSISSAEQGMNAIRDSKLLDNDEKKAKFEEASKIFEKMKTVGESSELLKKLYDETKSESGVSDETLKKLGESSSEFISEAAKNILSLKEKVASFKNKYSAGGDTIDFVKDYTEIENLLDSIDVSDNSSLSFKDIFGVDRGEISSFYDKIEELNNLVKE